MRRNTSPTPQGALCLRFIGALVPLALWLTVAHAQEYQLRHYGVADGLAHGAVHSILQDRKGYLWFSTREGLSRFDGYSFVNYGERDGLDQQLINDVLEDRQGRIWVATNGSGVALFVGDDHERSATKFKRFLIVNRDEQNAKAINSVNRLLIDSQDSLWAMTDGGLYRASLADDGLKFAALGVELVPDSYAALEDTHGRVWFGAGSRLIEISGGKVIDHGFAHGESTPSQTVLIKSILEDRAGRILVASVKGLYQFIPGTSHDQGDQWRRLPLTLRPNQNIIAALIDSAGDLYVATRAGLIKQREGQSQIEINRNSLGSFNIYTLAEDRNRNIWISAWARGVYKLSGEMIASYKQEDGTNLSAADVVEEDGVLKAVFFDGSIVAFSTGALKRSDALEYPPSLDHSIQIWRDKGAWWSGWLSGHFIRFRQPFIRLKDGRAMPLAALASAPDLEKGITFYEDQKGALWVNSKSSGKIRRATFSPKGQIVFEDIAGDFKIIGYGEQIIGDKSGSIWLATAERLCRIREHQFSCLSPTAGLPEIDPRSLFVDSRGWLWIGHRHRGVSVTQDPGAENPTFTNYANNNGLSSDTAWALTEDFAGQVYVGTGKGLSRFDPRNNTWQNFSSKDGLARDEITSFYRDRQGMIWIAADGVTRFDPRAEHPATEPPPIYISHVNVSGEDLNLPETGTNVMAPMQLAASRNNLTIDFVGVQFQGEDTLLYQHRLEGADSDWTAPTKSRSVNYASLSAGSYRFLVRAINRAGLVSPPAIFEFRILRPFYLRWWFLTLALLVVVSIASSLYRFRLRQLLALERVRTRIATDLHDDIGASLSRMAILSEVVRQQNNGGSQESQGRLAEIASSARELVDSMSDIVWSIDPRRDDLGHVVTRLRQFGSDVFEARGIAWELQVAPELERIKLRPEQRRDIFLICKEALNNVARHAECQHARLSLRVLGPQILVEIHDDGRGFVVPAGNAAQAGRGRGGHGLVNMQIRAARLGADFGITSDPGQGTNLRLSIPRHGRVRPRMNMLL